MNRDINRAGQYGKRKMKMLTHSDRERERETDKQ